MTLFLKAQCGSVQMLIDVSRVLEVFDPSQNNVQASDVLSVMGHTHWRDQVLPSINMPRYFGQQDTPVSRFIVVESGIDDPALRLMVLGVESSESLLSLEQGAMVDIAEHHDQLAPVFESVYSPSDSSACLLALRFPATWVMPIVAGVETV